jgi:hypothetical protein
LRKKPGSLRSRFTRRRGEGRRRESFRKASLLPIELAYVVKMRVRSGKYSAYTGKRAGRQSSRRAVHRRAAA